MLNAKTAHVLGFGQWSISIPFYITSNIGVQQTRPLNRLPEYLYDIVLCIQVIAIIKDMRIANLQMGQLHF